MLVSTSTHILLSLILLVPAVLGWLGCFQYPDVLEGRSLIDMAQYNIVCSTLCEFQGYFYYWRVRYRETVDQFHSYCLCAEEAPDFRYLVDGCRSRMSPPTAIGDFSDVTIDYFINGDPQYGWYWDDCYAWDGPREWIAVTDIRQCFAHCASNYRAVMVYRSDGSQECSCHEHNDWWKPDADPCIFDNIFAYARTFRDTKNIAIDS